MIRFLKSICIDNFDDFDMDFEFIGKNRFNQEQWDMVICKKTPWKYVLLRQFQDALPNIKYRYTLRFSYLQRPNSDEAIELFKEWYQTLYRLPLKLDVSGDKDDHLYIKYINEEEKNNFVNIIKDFKDFLSFLNYEFTITESLKPIEESIVISDDERKVLEDNAATDAEESIETINNKGTVNDRNDVLDKIEEERKEISIELQNTLLDQMRINAQQMKKERERARLNKRGNYKPIDNIDSITATSGSVDFDGKVFSIETKEFNGTVRLTIGVADKFGGAIMVSAYQGGQLSEEVVNNLFEGCNIRVRGVAYNDDYAKQLQIKGHYIDLLPKDEPASDDYEGEKRVELHLHSKMSAMDGVSEIFDYCELAKSMGHTAIAITDHAVVQAYPDAQHAADKQDIKMLYGCEFYVVDREQKYIKNPIKTPLNRAKYVVLDLETTGLSSKYNKIIEFGAVKVDCGTVLSSLDILINPEETLTDKIIQITDITNEMLVGKPTINEALPKIVEYLGDAILVTHNAEFDISFLQEALRKAGMPELKNPVIDTLALSRYLFPESRAHSLGRLCKNMEVFYDEEQAHRADYDANVLNDVFQPMLVRITKDNLDMTHEDLGKLQTPSNLLAHIKPFHICALAKDKEGIKALFELVSISHTTYLSDVPKVPRDELEKRREHLLLGSACFNGEVFNTARYYNEFKLMEVMSFYDYIEVQPLENYSYLVNMGDCTQEECKTFIKDIVMYAEQINKPVVATGDVHYASPNDKTIRDICIFAKGLKGTNHPLYPYSRHPDNKNCKPYFENPNQHYRSTREMLDAFSFLGEEKAKEIVITNTNKIANSIESLRPVPNKVLCPPVIENSSELLKDLCYGNAKALYGDPLPEFIESRLKTELDGIIGYGYSVIYYMAHKILKKAKEDGFIVGSRGSVGSSFAATMAGITEVNPLPPHYICPHCHHLEWTSESIPDAKSGYDLPDKLCPVCGKPMKHDGQNIPFETFLGFKADKTPDIDLNFPGDYQARAHDYTKVLLGAKNVFRAGTIETVAEKTAFGLTRGYLETMYRLEHKVSEEEAISKIDNYTKAKISFMASKCKGVKRTTGQHPGGIVVVPDNMDVNDFTPYQYPADDTESSWRTTHFDYHCIDKCLLKFDMLGHVDPVALKMMCTLTNIKMEDIPMNDPKVWSLFSSNEALGISHDYLGNRTGALALPEFGTETTRKILETTHPKSFSDLVIISGISHGTNVWSGNAETLIKTGVANLRQVIGCRDDIMTYLISMGVPSQTSFAIMEDVRHGSKLKDSYVEIMKANKVPQYYIDSCNKIKYLFPKGHAVAYVTMAVRVGYFKIYYPLEFYATFFTTRSDQYDIKTMIKGKDAVIARLDELKLKSRSKEKLSNKESDQLTTLTVALEMLQRGYKFANIDLYKSEPTAFVVDKENNALIPPFITLDNLGENNAVSVKEARDSGGKFMSKQDLIKRTKLTTTNIQTLTEMGVLDNLNESDQISLFDF